jgi:hypothetical protein
LHLEKAESTGVDAGELVEVGLLEIGSRLASIIGRPRSILERPVAIGKGPTAIGQRHRPVIGRHRAISGCDGAGVSGGFAITGRARTISRRARPELRSSLAKRRDGGVGHLPVIECSFVVLRGTVPRISSAITSESPYIPEPSNFIVLEGVRSPAQGLGDTRLAPR